jgi:predicted nucleotidyltransferase
VRPLKFDLPSDRITQFCQRWRVSELSLFGSVLRDDFRSDSDIDVMMSFIPDANWSLFDHVQMTQELEATLGRKVDLVSRRALERSRNLIRRQAILADAGAIYDAFHADSTRQTRGVLPT